MNIDLNDSEITNILEALYLYVDELNSYYKIIAGPEGTSRKIDGLDAEARERTGQTIKEVHSLIRRFSSL